MKNLIRIIAIALVGLLCLPGNVMADKYRSDKEKDNKGSSQNNVASAGCLPGDARINLDINNVKARINQSGDMWWDLQGNPQYEVPKGSGKHSMFSASLWMAGVDVNGQLKAAAQRYRNDGVDFWPGPLSTDGKAAVDAETCKAYDKHWIITRPMVEAFIAWRDNPADYPDYTIPLEIMNYPAHGDVSKNQSYYLAPFFDYDGDGTYDPTAGDYPYYDFENDLCKNYMPTMEGNGILEDQVLKGDQTVWWVFNDKGNVHAETESSPIGVEIRAQAFAFTTSDEINNSTFYSYEIINRSTFRLTNTYFSQWVDMDLGDPYDDYVGCDVARGLGYSYNGDAVDGSGRPDHYGAQPPAIGVDFFQGPYIDPDGLDNAKFKKVISYDIDTTITPSDTIIDTLSVDTVSRQVVDESINGVNFEDGIVDNERFGMRKFVYHNNIGSGQNPAMTDPQTGSEYYMLLRGIWKDGTRMLYGGNAHYNSGAYGPECDFMFPGDTDPWDWGTGEQPPNGQKYWTEETAGNPPYDRRFMQSAGPFTLEAGAVNYITVGIPWARAASGGPFASVQLLREIDDKLQRLFDNCFQVLDGPDAPDLAIQEMDKKLILYLSNRPISNNYKEEYEEWDPTIITPDSINEDSLRYDSTYVFEGYQIFQLKDKDVSIAEIHDPDKARLVAQCDVENDVDKLVNFEMNTEMDAVVPQMMVDGENQGINHSFEITEDAFATGDRRLVNHRKYYYIAIAYGYNEYLKYSQDPGNLQGLYGQQMPYLPGRKAAAGGITPVTAIPHIPAPEQEGTEIKAEYGEGPKITRIEGQGNGKMVLELTEESLEAIMDDPEYRIEHPEYQNGYGPVNVKVIDPLNVKAGNYTIIFDVDGGDLDNAGWVLLDSEDMTDTIAVSEQTIAVDNEQLIMDIGLSVDIRQVIEPGDPDELQDNGVLTSSLTFADSSKQWLGGVPNQDASPSLNWIRAGSAEDEANPENTDYFTGPPEEKEWLDPNENFEKIVGGTWTAYRMAARTDQMDHAAAHFQNFQISNELSDLSSVDIIFTDDKSKWTRCPVIEMGNDNALTEGNAPKWRLRESPSVDKDGNPDGSGKDGMGWFPGYAINVETGERLNMMFGEDSWLIGENGRDMIWNPTSSYFTDLGVPLLGGKHYVYVFGNDDQSPAYDEGQWAYGELSTGSTTWIGLMTKSIMWVGMPLLNDGYDLLETEARVKIRVQRPYERYYSTQDFKADNPINDNYPVYEFTTKDIATNTGDNEIARNMLDTVKVVPNPYYGYSKYESNQLDNRVRITNLPDVCTIKIYSIDGTLIRTYTKDSEITSVDWNLKNHADIPISSGLYLIHVDAPGIGETVVKWFGSMRPADMEAF
ncbi:MAG: T9SS type A sorting domain-containing protein [Bacteroidales bacterium]